MKKIIYSFGVATLLLLGLMNLRAGDDKKNPVPVKDPKAEKRKADSLQYANFTTDTKDYTYLDVPNEVLLFNGMKIKLLSIRRFPIPRGVNVVIPDEMSQRFLYDLAELELEATNTNAKEVKLGASASEALFMSMKLYTKEMGSKAYVSQYPLSYGSVYGSMEPAQPEQVPVIYKATTAMINEVYKPGETKKCKGIIVCMEKKAKTVEKMIINNQEFGTNKSYGCPVALQ